ncbi:MAG: hypothetical protein ACLFP8_06065 [Alphaproteobacteria bacterium]
MVDRVSTYAQSGSLLKDLMQLQSQYAKGVLQQSSGFISDTYDEIGSDTQRLLNFESEYSEISAQSENAQIAMDRVEIMYDNVSLMLDLISLSLGDIAAALGGTTVDGSYISAELQQGIEELASRLNAQSDSTYLFAGGASIPPVNLNDPDYALVVDPLIADTEYYQGGDYTFQVQASSGLTVDYGVRADNSGFEKALRAYNLALNNPEDEATLREAYALMSEGFEEINTMQTILSSQATTLDNQIDNNTEELALLDGLISNIKQADLAEVTMKLAELETQLEASYAVATKLLQLNLYDYIR